MVTRETHLSALPLTDRLSFRLTLLFAAVFFTVFFGTWVYDALASFAQSRLAEESLSVQAAPIVIDPKIQSDLAKVMASDSIPSETDVRDPFNDRSGLSNVAKLSGGTAAAAPQRTSAQAGSAGNRLTTPTQSLLGSNLTPPDTGMTEQAISVAANKRRYQDWLAQKRAGVNVGPVNEFLGVDDFVPVGFASGGNGADEVILYSLSLCHTFNFTAGTRFLDGWLNAFNQQEVLFIVNNSVWRKSFAQREDCQSGKSIAENESE